MADDLDEILAAFERHERSQQARLVAFFIEKGRPDLAEDYMAKLRDIELGIDGARGTWHALSPAQRRTLESLGDGRSLCRASGSRTQYDAIANDRTADLDSDFGICRLPTARNLASRELIVVAGGATDPERRFVITERGLFIIEHGPAQP